MEPTTAELIFWIVLAIISWVFIGLIHLPWNDRYDPKGDDPYRYCPKEEDEW